MKRRFVASAIDWIIIAIVASLLSVCLPSYKVNDFEVFKGGATVLFIVTSVLFKDLLFRNASLGKKIMGLEIVESGSINKSTVSTIIKRNIILLVSIMCFVEFFVLIKKKNRLSDMWFNTQVVPSASIKSHE